MVVFVDGFEYSWKSKLFPESFNFVCQSNTRGLFPRLPFALLFLVVFCRCACVVQIFSCDNETEQRALYAALFNSTAPVLPSVRRAAQRLDMSTLKRLIEIFGVDPNRENACKLTGLPSIISFLGNFLLISMNSHESMLCYYQNHVIHTLFVLYRWQYCLNFGRAVYDERIRKNGHDKMS